MANNICGPFQTNNNEILEIGRDSGVGSRYVLMNFRPKFTLKEEIHVHICFEYFYYGILRNVRDGKKQYFG